MHHNQHHLRPFVPPGPPATPFFVKVSPRPHRRRVIGGGHAHRLAAGNGMVGPVPESMGRIMDPIGPMRKRTFTEAEEGGAELGGGECGEVAAEVEVDVVNQQEDDVERRPDEEEGHREEEESEEAGASGRYSQMRQHIICPPSSSSFIDTPGPSSADQPPPSSLSNDPPNLRSFALRPRQPYRARSGPAGISSIQQLLKFDPNQCFDIDELRARMLAAQRKIEDLCSLNLNNVKLKQENGQLREELGKCDHRINLLESTVLERNERLKELLRENVFMRAQFKKVQNEFGMEAVKDVFNQQRRDQGQ